MFSETAMLLMVEGPSPGRRIFMEKQHLIIGRDERCDLVVAERQVSRQHATITLEGEGYVVRDLGSKNGTFVNGRELDGPHLLQDGDEIQIAYCCKLAFVGAEATAPVIPMRTDGFKEPGAVQMIIPDDGEGHEGPVRRLDDQLSFGRIRRGFHKLPV